MSDSKLGEFRGGCYGTVAQHSIAHGQDLQFVGKERTNSSFQLTTSDALLSHLVALRRRLAVPLITRHAVRAITIKDRTATMR